MKSLIDQYIDRAAHAIKNGCLVITINERTYRIRFGWENDERSPNQT